MSNQRKVAEEIIINAAENLCNAFREWSAKKRYFFMEKKLREELDKQKSLKNLFLEEKRKKEAESKKKKRN